MGKKKWGAGDLIIIVIIGVALTSWLKGTGDGVDNKKPSSSSSSQQVQNSKEAPVAFAGDVISIVTPDNSARLCKNVGCGQGKEILTLPTNTKLKVVGLKKQSLPKWDVIWYKVSYKNKLGWVSEHNTNKSPKELRYR